MDRFLPYSRQWIDEEDIKNVVEVLKENIITQGEKIEQFEKALAEIFGAKYAVVFNSGTSALHGAYFALSLGKNDEFITTPISFVATSNAGLYLGAKPVFVDIDSDTGCIDASLIEKHINPKTKLISVVHYGGHPVDMDVVWNIADRYGLFVVEDACHALGSKYKGKMIGDCKRSSAVIFSFHPLKHITTGEGGAVLTNYEDVYNKLKMFRNSGITKDKRFFENKSDGDWYYEMQILGFNYKMTDFQAALGLSQLKKLERFVKKRREIANFYDTKFEGNKWFNVLKNKDFALNSYHLYPIRLKGNCTEKKQEIFKALRKSGLGVQVHYIPIYLQPFYKKLGYKQGLCPEAEAFYRQELSLPIFPLMDEKDVEFVISAVFDVFERMCG
nr:UDP-4-amino-4,6-dideoxy-N-acetyl-beta-L-altrosamine transaminase [Hippea jasoniae]